MIIRDNVLTVGTKEFVIDLRFLYVIATMLILYCIISSRRVMQNVSILTIKKFYYCFWFAVYTFYINRIDFSYFNQDTVLALPVEIGVPLAIFLVGTLLAVLIDSFIVSGTGFIEFSLLGAKFVRSEISTNFELQNQQLELLVSKLAAENAIITNFDEYMKCKVDISAKVMNGIDFAREYKELIKEYLSYQPNHNNVDVDIIPIAHKEKFDFKSKYDISYWDFKMVEKSLDSMNPVLIEKPNPILFIPFHSVRGYHRDIVVILSSKSPLILQESYIISNLLTSFHEYAYNSLKLNNTTLQSKNTDNTVEQIDNNKVK